MKNGTGETALIRPRLYAVDVSELAFVQYPPVNFTAGCHELRVVLGQTETSTCLLWPASACGRAPFMLSLSPLSHNQAYKGAKAPQIPRPNEASVTSVTLFSPLPPYPNIMMRIAIAGGAGLGYLLAKELSEAANAYNVVVLSRCERPEYAALDVQVMQVNYDDYTSLSYALHGVNLVISIVSGNEQLNLINAAAQSGVQLFVPSEFEGALDKRPSENDQLDPASSSSQARTLLRRCARSSQMKWTVFSCGVFMERFLPQGLGSLMIGYGKNLSDPGSYLLDMNSYTAEYVEKDARGRTVRVCMTSVYDVARFVVAAIDLGPANWPREFTMRGDRLSVRDVVGQCGRALNAAFQLSQWQVADLPQLVSGYYQQGDYGRVTFYQQLQATVEGRYDFGQTSLNDLVNSSPYIDVQPRSFRQWLAEQFPPSA
ncbi:hypothetical protein NM208_g10421 [Fusarium decemcellulare]|uniref:Uncharacterized protein n=1 Tax=Fusarium decemcellulare TaxID=57161 RepID=A0ACC1RXW9_9HYPO|nr:hypothetical protein NM208_g10421 [Fusarium decemcellulare]